MYNANSIESFINKVNKEAEEAAQKVYDNYETEYKSRLLAQIKRGDQICVGMGVAFIKNEKGNYVGEKLALVLENNEYHSLKVGLNTNDIKK